MEPLVTRKLGLALVKGLIELHWGSVQAESKGAGEGSRFTIRLPLEPDLDVKPEGNTGIADQAEVGRLRILLVEDNRDAAITLKMRLTSMGYAVFVACDGPEGLELAISIIPDVVISDLGLPGAIDGYALANEIRSDATLAGVYLIALSGYGQDDDRRRTVGAGFDRYFVKPVEPESLQEALSKFALAKQRSSSTKLKVQ